MYTRSVGTAWAERALAEVTGGTPTGTNRLGGQVVDPPLADQLEERLVFEALVVDLCDRLVGIRPRELAARVESALAEIGQLLQLDRVALWEPDSAEGVWRPTHAWGRPGVGPSPSTWVVGNVFPWSLRQTRRGDPLVIRSLADLPPAAAQDAATYRRAGVRSLVAIPMMREGVVAGVLTFATFRGERPWAQAVVDRLRVVTGLVQTALDRKREDEALQRTLAELHTLKERLRHDNADLRSETRASAGRGRTIGRGLAFERTVRQVERVARTDATVLLLGETGTGKELLAEAIHQQSARRERPMVRVNCAALPATLVESELFGRERGAYTGALTRQVGRFELAHGSTIFLDEIGDLPLEVQVKLLRVLEEREIERLGNPRPIRIDVRVIAATHRDLPRLLREGKFREDLYYRLNVFPVTVPPLRERREDIPQLVWGFVEELSGPLGVIVERVAPESLARLERYAWPGNVRELRNAVERAMIMHQGPELWIEAPTLRIEAPEPADESPPAPLALAEAQRHHIVSVLEQAAWRIRGAGGAAAMLGLKPTTLETRMARLGIRRPGA
jgi:transcriptional regulator with GAF, ATPase, and Fis domain